jgi:hypothetical protein
MAIARKRDDNLIEILIGKDLYVFKSLSWLDEMVVKEVDGISRERQLMARATISVSNNLTFTYEEKLKLMRAIPLAIFKRVYTIYKALEADGRRPFKTIHLYIAPEVTKVLGKIKMEDEDMEETLNAVFGDDEAEVRETEELILKNSGLKGATKI